jgi:formate hydrogenlyase subunit 6/NADH:ubiquinone oxidoreductase subunit I
MSQRFFKASKEAVRNLFRSPNTVMFPSEHVIVPENIRGAPELDPTKCSLCKRCERACPTHAIAIEKTGKKTGFLRLDLGLCCYCQECEKNCNFGAITLNQTWLTAEIVRNELLRTYEITSDEECEEETK